MVSALRQISDTQSLFDVKAIELLLKVSLHQFSFFEEDFINEVNYLMWIIPTNPIVIDVNEYQQMYDHLLAIGSLDMHSYMSNEPIAYKVASSFVEVKYKKKMGKKKKQQAILKYTNFVKSKSFLYFIKFQQSMYVLCNC